MATMQILEPTTDMVQVKVLTLRIIQETVEIKYDSKYSDNKKLTYKTFHDIIPYART